MADRLLSVMRPIKWSPSLDGCHVTGCYRVQESSEDERQDEGSYEVIWRWKGGIKEKWRGKGEGESKEGEV